MQRAKSPKVSWGRLSRPPSCSSWCRARRNRSHRCGYKKHAEQGNEAVEEQHAFTETAIAIDEALSRGLGVARTVFKEGEFKEISGYHRPQQAHAVVGAGPGALHQVAHSNGGTGKEEARPQVLEKAF